MASNYRYSVKDCILKPTVRHIFEILVAPMGIHDSKTFGLGRQSCAVAQDGSLNLIQSVYVLILKFVSLCRCLIEVYNLCHDFRFLRASFWPLSLFDWFLLYLAVSVSDCRDRYHPNMHEQKPFFLQPSLITQSSRRETRSYLVHFYANVSFIANNFETKSEN